MRKGGGGKKGAGFERKVCKALSLWVSRGQHEDLFWRSSMSGGRATVARKRGAMVRQAGDICSVSPEGHPFTDQWYIECKFYRDIDLSAWMIKNRGKLAKWWARCRKEAKHYKRKPLLIAKQNGWPVLVISKPDHLYHIAYCEVSVHNRHADVTLLSNFLNGYWKDTR